MLLRVLIDCCRSRQDLALENLVLRHQLEVLLRRKPKPRLRDRDRILYWQSPTVTAKLTAYLTAYPLDSRGLLRSNQAEPLSGLNTKRPRWITADAPKGKWHSDGQGRVPCLDIEVHY